MDVRSDIQSNHVVRLYLVECVTISNTPKGSAQITRKHNIRYIYETDYVECFVAYFASETRAGTAELQH